MKNTIFVNTIDKCEDKDNIDIKFKKCHTNTGNLVWHDRCRQEIAYDNIIQLNEVNNFSENNILVVPVSNNLSAIETVFSKKLYSLESTKAKVVLIGLGVQPPHNKMMPAEFIKMLPKRKIRMMRNISEKSVSIGVRGEYTAECLERMGIYNIRVIGCPSFYSNTIKTRDLLMPRPTLENVCINITGGITEEKKILELIIRSGVKSKIIRQGKNDNIDTVLINEDNKKISRFFNTKQLDKITNNEIKKYWENNAFIFWELKKWENFIKKEKFSFCLGSRLHGNILSYLMGVPSLLIVHDIRTQEIAELLKLPHISKKNINKIRYIEQLQERCIYNADFYRNYYKMRKYYISFLEENGVKHEFI